MSELEKPLFPRWQANRVALKIMDGMGDALTNYMIIGSIRRLKEHVHDIDLVAMPGSQMLMRSTYINNLMADATPQEKAEVSIGDKIIKFYCKHIPVQIWIANSEPEYEMLKLVHTGSRDFVTRLASVAIEKNLALRFGYSEEVKQDLYGLYGAFYDWGRDDNGNKFRRCTLNVNNHPAWTERDVIVKLEGKYVEPKDRVA